MKKAIINISFLIIILFTLIGIINNPKLSLESGYSGLLTWFNIIVPSLLPFFMISEILKNIGFVDLIGKFLKPFMKYFFNVPGNSAFPFSMSIASGYPMGAKIVADLRMNNTLTKIEAERTICFASTSGPLFMLGAVSIGMLNNPSIAPIIIYPHYLGAISVGIILSFYKREIRPAKNVKENFNVISSFFSNIKKDFSIGYILNNSVRNSLNAITIIGGFIIFYSVLTELLFASKAFNKFIELLIYTIPIKINIEAIKGFIAGIIELTTGCKLISSANIPLYYKIILINFLIGWSGFSIHSQVLSFINNTDIDSKIYIFSKLLHGLLSSIYGFLFYIIKYKSLVEPSFMPKYQGINLIHFNAWPVLLFSSCKIALISNIYLLILSLISAIINPLSSRD
ncbi:sporulation integral membrane protein YlbJ [Tepidimicrobium xylanilyticum]